MLQDYVQYNFILVINIVFFMLFLMTNTLLERNVVRKFEISLVLLVIMTIAENMEFWASSLTYPSALRVTMSLVGYIIRPVIIYELILIVEDGSALQKKVLTLPAIVNALVMSTAFYSDIAFSYSSDNEFVRGPLGLFPYLCCMVYFVMILTYSVRSFRERCYIEAAIIFAIVAACVIAAVMETVWSLVGLLRTTIGLSITFFYLYLHAQTFKRDALTGALNRRCFYLDAGKYRDKITALISVDLNDLKRINDSKGHAEGDRAIITVVGCMKKCLLRGCILYRTGGDEFGVLCLKRKKAELEEMVNNMRAAMAETPYACSFGLAEAGQDEEFEDLCDRADAAMYQDKAYLVKNSN